jgi:Dyp-type peroxidase family
VERADVQGLVLFGYKQHPRSRFYLLDFAAGQPREWLRRVLSDVSSGSEPQDSRFYFNLAFSARGLELLGLGQELPTFAREFVQGMGHPERSNVLGDRYADDPEHWQFGSAERPVHALALLYARSDADLGERSAELEALLAKFGVRFTSDDVCLPDDGAEHFGFSDGLAQPLLKGSGRTRKRGEAKLAAGEIVLGYANAYGQLTDEPSAERRSGTREHPFPISGTSRVRFGQNGSYLVLRKLQQDVAAFWSYCWDAALAEQAPDVEQRAKLIGARFIGRWPNGVSLVESPDAERPPVGGLNDFGFRERDPHGLRCPLGAHVRRANPRDMFGDTAKDGLHDANLHRILRRGRAFGPKLPGAMPRVDDGQSRGLYFMALNANLKRQFEFVQQSWLNNCKFAGLSSERDPLVGKEAREIDDASLALPRVFSVQARPVRQRYEQLPKVVRVLGGEYFFLPGLRALNYLCDGPR